MTTAMTFKSATTKELQAEIDSLITLTGMTWEELEKAAEAFNLSDTNLATYRTIKSIRWVALGL